MSKSNSGGSRLRWLLMPVLLAAAVVLLAVVFTSCNGDDSSPSPSDGSDVGTRPVGTDSWKTDWSKAVINLDELVSELHCGDEIGYGLTEATVVGKNVKYGFAGF